MTGYWEAVEGDVFVEESQGQIHRYPWYVIRSTNTGFEVVWDNGETCIFSGATRKGDRLHLTVDGVEATFDFKDGRRSTATFSVDGKEYVKELVKKRESTEIACM